MMKDCNRLRLLDILVRPMQRLTKYSLLLKAILKKTDDGLTRNNLILMVRIDNKISNGKTKNKEVVRCHPKKLEMFQKSIKERLWKGPPFTEEFVELNLLRLIGKVCLEKKNFSSRQNAKLAIFL